MFISHGGLIGTQEAVFHGVPIIGVPIYGDQYNNLLIAQNAGIGKILKYHDITEEHLENILRAVLENDSYSENAKKMSIRFQDRPMTALDTAVFWVEYVIRNNGANFIKNPANTLSWYAYYMLDILGLLLSIMLMFAFVVVKLFTYLLRKKSVISTKKIKYN